MPALRAMIRRGRRGIGRGAVAVAAAAGLAVLAGCGGDEADIDRGRALFTQHCSQCHTLAQAGSASQIGPDLDAAFADARASGMTDSTIEGVVRNQIANPREIRDDHPFYDRVFMPADIVTGQDAEDVAAYVGGVAGVPDAAPPDLPPEELFVERCGGCHTLEAAGTQATTGPDLDEVLTGQDAAMIEESIVMPDEQITPGFQPGVMPDDFEQVLDSEDLMGLVQLLVETAAGGGGGGGGGGGQG